MKTITKLMLIVFLLGLMLRFMTVAVLWPNLNPDVNRDHYRALAKSLVEGKGFVAFDDRTQRVLPNVARTPVYPFFLAFLMQFVGDRLDWLLGAQCVLGGISAALTTRLAAHWLTERGAALAGSLVAIDPNSIMRCADLMSEILFTLLLLGGAYLLTCRGAHQRAWFGAGVLWSLAALCRPIAVWLWLVVLIILIVWRFPIRLYIVFLIGFLPLLMIWAVRNHLLTGHLFISTIATQNLRLYRAAGVEAESRGLPLEAVQKEVLRTQGDLQFLDSPEQFQQRLTDFRKTARRILFHSPRIVVKQTIVGFGKILLGPGARAIDNALRQPPLSVKWWPPIYAVVLAAVVVLAALGAVKLRRRGALAVALTAYFVLLAGGPEANSRFRVPITPLLAILAVAASTKLRKE